MLFPEDSHLILEIPVDFLDATLGGEVTVQAMDSRLALRIPELKSSSFRSVPTASPTTTATQPRR